MFRDAEKQQYYIFEFRGKRICVEILTSLRAFSNFGLLSSTLSLDCCFNFLSIAVTERTNTQKQKTKTKDELKNIHQQRQAPQIDQHRLYYRLTLVCYTLNIRSNYYNVHIFGHKRSRFRFICELKQRLSDKCYLHKQNDQFLHCSCETWIKI